MISRLKTANLVFTAGSLGIGISIMAVLLGKERDNHVNKQGFVSTAGEFIRKQPTVTNILGNDIELGQAKLNDGWSKLRENHVQVKVPVKGERDSGYLLVYARREEPKSAYKLRKLEMTFDKIRNKKLVLMDLDEGIKPVIDEESMQQADKESNNTKGKTIN